MSHKAEHVSTKNGFWVKNGSTRTQVITQAGAITADIQATAGSIGTAELANNAVTSAKLDTSTVQYVEVPLTAAQILGMSATPVEVIPAVAGKAIILDSFVFDLTGTATQFANGGVVNLQYKNTATGAGTTLHADIAATVLTSATGNVKTIRIPKDLSAVATADIANVGVFISNKTAAFITGTGTAVCKVTYHLV